MTRPNHPDTPSRTQADLQRQIDAALRSSQLGNSTIREGALLILDADGAARLSLGEYIWPSGIHAGTAVYGLVVFDAGGFPVIVEGQQPDGTYGRGVYDDTGHLLVFEGAAGFTAGPVSLGTNGITISDGTRIRAALGHLPDGDYGLSVTDTVGNTQEVLPTVIDEIDTQITVTSTTDVSSGGPSQAAVIGASGAVELTISAYIALGQSNTTGGVSLYIDGGFALAPLALSSQGVPIAANCSTTRLITGLSPGNHTFELRYKTSTGSTSFAGRTLSVTPL
jgi:hypothetical protein